MSRNVNSDASAPARPNLYLGPDNGDNSHDRIPGARSLRLGARG